MMTVRFFICTSNATVMTAVAIRTVMRNRMTRSTSVCMRNSLQPYYDRKTARDTYLQGANAQDGYSPSEWRRMGQDESPVTRSGSPVNGETGAMPCAA